MNNLESAVVIPANKEGTNILHTLASIGRSEKVDRSRIGIFVVVNQTRDALQAVTDSNKETAGVVRPLAERKMPEDLSREKRQVFTGWEEKFKTHFGDTSISEREAAQELLDSGMQIREVNMWDGEGLRDICNVGIARDAGVRAAIPALADPACAILVSDADVYFGRDKIFAVRDNLERNPDTFGLTGDLFPFFSIDPGDDLSTLNDQIVAVECQRMASATGSAARYLLYHKAGYKAGLASSKKAPELDTTGFSGCDTNFRASAYEKVTFPPISGGEDLEFDLNMRKEGLRIVRDGRILSAYSYRFSERATTGVGRSLLEWKEAGMNLEIRKKVSPKIIPVAVKILNFLRDQQSTPLSFKLFRLHLLNFNFNDGEDLQCISEEDVKNAWDTLQKLQSEVGSVDEKNLFYLSLELAHKFADLFKVNDVEQASQTISELQEEARCLRKSLIGLSALYRDIRYILWPSTIDLESDLRDIQSYQEIGKRLKGLRAAYNKFIEVKALNGKGLTTHEPLYKHYFQL